MPKTEEKRLRKGDTIKCADADAVSYTHLTLPTT